MVFVIEKCGVFAVQTEFLNNIYMSVSRSSRNFLFAPTLLLSFLTPSLLSFKALIGHYQGHILFRKLPSSNH
jgi:hypothetical protein